MPRGRLGDVQEWSGVVEGARLVLCLRRRQRTLCVTMGLSCQRGGALQERGGGRQTAPRLSPACRPLELAGDVLVRAGRSLCRATAWLSTEAVISSAISALSSRWRSTSTICPALGCIYPTQSCCMYGAAERLIRRNEKAWSCEFGHRGRKGSRGWQNSD